MTELRAICSSSSSSPSLLQNVTDTVALLYSDTAHCLTACISLSPVTIAPYLPSVCTAICDARFQHGSHALHRLLCAALENFGAETSLQPPLLTCVGFLLTMEPAQPFYGLAGGDSDPQVATALLTVANALVRQLSSCSSTISSTATWTHQSPEPLLQCIGLVLRLSAANVACNHRDTCQRAVTSLSATLVLILDSSFPLHLQLIEAARSEGGVMMMRGVILCLISLHSASLLPKIVTMMADVAMIAVEWCWCSSFFSSNASVAGEEDRAPALVSATLALLHEWWVAAQQSLQAAGALPPAVSEVLMKNWHWVDVVDAAVGMKLARSASEAGRNSVHGRGAAEVRRGVQRAVRHLADQIRRVS